MWITVTVYDDNFDANAESVLHNFVYPTGERVHVKMRLDDQNEWITEKITTCYLIRELHTDWNDAITWMYVCVCLHAFEWCINGSVFRKYGTWCCNLPIIIKLTVSGKQWHLGHVISWKRKTGENWRFYFPFNLFFINFMFSFSQCARLHVREKKKNRKHRCAYIWQKRLPLA